MHLSRQETSEAPAGASWWLDPLPAATAGLSEGEARARLAVVGPNLLRAAPRRSLLLRYLGRFGNPLIVILLGASAISAFTQQLTDFAIISAIVVLSVTLDFVQEYRANAAAEKLHSLVALRAKVLRDGQARTVAVADLVPGDVALLAAGDKVPADGRLLAADDLFVNQALLTGESYPVEKHPERPKVASANPEEATNALFMGTSVISGSARLLVVRTGSASALGDIAARVREPVAPTSFETGVRRFGMLIMRLTVLMVMFVLFVNTLFHRPLLESFLFAIALAVGLTPELLPMVVSVTLARGAVRMARKSMIVKRMSAIQDLGSIDVLCTDKTGTLTEANIRLERHVDALGHASERVLALAYLNSVFETGLKSPLDEAILAHGQVDVGRWRKVDEVPFDFERRRVSVLIDNAETRWLVVKGAPDEVAGLCTHYELHGGAATLPINPAALQRIRAQYHALEDDGLRVLGIAWREVARDHPHAAVGDEAGLVLAGFAAFVDPPKESAAGALKALHELGVAIKVVTGDSDRVTRHLCSQLHLPIEGILSGKDVAAMDDHALRAKVDKTTLFCRIAPLEKNRIILAFRARGHVVGYLGDGINDALPLRSADVGLSVDSAVDVAKEAADMILLAPDLLVLRDGVIEGRRTFGNIMKYIMMGTSSNFGNMLSMAAASLFLPFLPMLPTQILLNNILYDLSEIAIPLDTVDAVETRVPRVLDLGFVRNFMLVLGATSSLFDLLTFYVLLAVLHADEKTFQTGWFVESLCTQVLVIFVIRTRGRPWESAAHPVLAATSVAIVLIALALPSTVLGARFGLVPLAPAFYAALGAMVVLYLVVVEMVKRRFYRASLRPSRAHASHAGPGWS